MFYTVHYNSGSPPTVDVSDDEEAEIEYFLISPILNLAVGVAEVSGENLPFNPDDPDSGDRLYVTSLDPNKWAEDITISAVSTAASTHAKVLATKLFEDRIAAINSNLGFVIKNLGLDGLTGKYFPWYLIIDGDNVTLQGYDYFWDPDERFQSVFRDRMGGNHQWLFNWYNLGGRSELADIVEVSVSPAGQPLMKFFWEQGGKHKELLRFVDESCKTQDVLEFNKRSKYIKARGKKHLVDGEMEPSDALDYALRDLKSATKRQDPDVFYQEYAEMGFDHPRPDYKDKKWKL